MATMGVHLHHLNSLHQINLNTIKIDYFVGSEFIRLNRMNSTRQIHMQFIDRSLAQQNLQVPILSKSKRIFSFNSEYGYPQSLEQVRQQLWHSWGHP